MLVRSAPRWSTSNASRAAISPARAGRNISSSGSVCGIPLPAGLQESDRLPEPIFTPSTKAAPVTTRTFPSTTMVAPGRLETRRAALRDLTLAIYSHAPPITRAPRGIIIADTKFEFGFVDGELILADEVLTPDSSRFWPADTYSPGGPQPSYDKQYVRDYLESIRWNKQPPAPASARGCGRAGPAISTGRLTRR